ncbi:MULTISPECIES: metallophosphoesterase [Achromobacter]|jgi:serine/threonine protein phosphatase 1|uniref:Serine/threonine-protein phosphatase 2 n=1 Tax=Achromobacter insolitus TaxID=217204 RepID=A0A6S7F7D7_9BURK|nr:MULTISPECIES: metallophosphoesterase [Achromobacter]GLK94289.1 serine/threonine protein phosphatase [Achromobacter xylosoxidans]APX73796.1 serine/threonine protein phosphatase [Achromobacter insolitus]AVG38633.1 serine/threonine protein phosphatase [Achromobacter insolitus]MDQ6217441.1 metallophosphoesterase [Achromobacter insolitus]MEB3099639.1 metallophosphoesterase [Achromobacter sp. D10]
MEQRFLKVPRNELGRDFAVGDLHGHFSRLEESLGQLGFDPATDRLFSVGDLVDRGPESEAALEWLARPWFYAVQGNHEDYAIRHVRTGQVDVDNWRGYGGGWFLDLPSERQKVFAEAFAQLPIAIEVETLDGAVGLLHADCPVLFWPRLESALQDRYRRTSAACQWSRDRLRQMDRTGIRGVRAVVAGHTPVPAPLVLGNVYHIDTEGWKSGYFTFLDLESLQAWPREVVTELAEQE